MVKGTGSGKGRSGVRLFDGINRENLLVKVYKEITYSVDEYVHSGERVKRYCVQIKFNPSALDIVKNIIEENGGRRAVTGYDVFLRRCADKHVVVCVDLNNEFRDIGVKKCEEITKGMIDQVLNRFMRKTNSGRRSDEKSVDMDDDVFDKLEQVKVLISELIQNDVKNMSRKALVRDNIINHAKKIYADILDRENKSDERGEY